MTKTDFSEIGVVIPVREGSTRVKDKVVLPFTGGLNLLEWKLEQMKQVVKPSNIFVSTDSQKLQEIANKRGVSIHERDPYLCRGHDASFSEVITGIVKDIPKPHIAWVTVVVPLMSPKDYESGFKNYLQKVLNEKSHDSLVSVNLIKEYFWDEKGPLNYKANKNHTVSQYLPDWFRVTNGLYMKPKQDVLKDKYFLGRKPYMHQVGKMAGIDIDEWEDYEFSLAMLKFYEIEHAS